MGQRCKYVVDPSTPATHSIMQDVTSGVLQLQEPVSCSILALTSHAQSRDAGIEEIIHAFKI